MSRNFLRKCLISLSGTSSLTVPGGGPKDLRVEFYIGQSTLQTPNTARVRITNPSPQTTAAFKDKEFQTLEIQAGYEDNVGFLYRGDIRQSIIARDENVVDSYIDVIAATAGNPYQMANVGKTLAAGWTPMDKVNVALEAMKPYGITGLGLCNVDLSQPQHPRGRPFIGMARDLIRQVALSAGAVWWMDDDGKVNIVDHSKALPNGTAVELNSGTGLVGFPHISENGIIARCLINPAIKVASLVHIDESSIIDAERDNSVAGGFGTVGDRNKALDMAGKIAADGLYRVAFMETEADTRGQSWHQILTCIALGGSINSAQAQSYIGPDLSLGSY